MYTSEIFEEITNSICLSPNAEYELKKILSYCEGELVNDIELEDEEDDDE